MLLVAALTTTALAWAVIGQPIPDEGIWRYHVFCYNHTGLHPISCEKNSIIKVNEVTRGYSPQYSWDETSGPVCPVNPSCSIPHFMPGICDTERTCQVSPLTPRAPISPPCASSLNVTHSNYLLFNYSCISVTALSSQMLCEESTVIQSSGHIFSPDFPRVVSPGRNRSCRCILQAPSPTPITLQSFHLHLASRSPCREHLTIFADQDRQLLYVCSPDFRQPGWSVTFTTSVIQIDYIKDAIGADHPGGKVWLGFTANSSLWVRCGSDALSISKTLPPLKIYTPEVTTEEQAETTAPRSRRLRITPGVMGGIAAAGFLLIVCIVSSIICSRRANRRQNPSNKSKEGDGEIYAYINPATLNNKNEPPKEKPPEPPLKLSTFHSESGAKIRNDQQRTKVPSPGYNLQYNNSPIDVQYDIADATYYYYDELQPVVRHGVNDTSSRSHVGLNNSNKKDVFQLLQAAELNKHMNDPQLNNSLSQINLQRNMDLTQAHFKTGHRLQPQPHTLPAHVSHLNTIPANARHLNTLPANATHLNALPSNATQLNTLPAGPPYYYEHLQYDPYTEIPAIYAFLDQENTEEQQHRF